MADFPIYDDHLLDNSEELPAVLAIGDSWFWYPMNNLLGPINAMLDLVSLDDNDAILVRGGNGYTTGQYLNKRLLRQIQRDLSPGLGYGEDIKAIFISGGGNDIAGMSDMDKILKDDCSNVSEAQQCFDVAGLKQCMDNIKANYDRLISEIRELSPDSIIFVHTYDYPNPNGKGFLGIGQWLRDPMVDCNIAEQFHQEVVNLLIDTFTDRVINTLDDDNLEVVDCRGTLSRDDWANELHPTISGFNKLAKGPWRKALIRRGILRVS